MTALIRIRAWWIALLTEIDMALHPDDYGAHRNESIAEDDAIQARNYEDERDWWV